MRIILFIFKIAALSVLLIFSITATWATFMFAPWSPTRKKDMKRIKDVMNIKKGDTVYDLGCGDGRMCLYLGKHTKAKKIVGIELSYFYYAFAKLKVFTQDKSKRITIMWGNFFNTKINDATIVFLYLTSKTASKLTQKLFNEMKSGSMVFSYNYPIPGWEYIKKNQPRKEDTPIYVYKVGKEMRQVMFDE